MRTSVLTAGLCTLLVTGAGLLSSGVPTRAASHSDAPLIKQDPQANITDVYTFIGSKYNNAAEKVLNVVVHVRPFSEPGDGVMYERFADDALYSIHIANPTTGAEVLRYNFQFSAVNPQTTPGLKNPNTILSYGLGTEAGPIMTLNDGRRNYTQTYTLTKVVGGSTSTLGTGLITPPPNVGRNTTPLYNDSQGRAVSGFTSFATLDPYTRDAIAGVASGEAVFAGPREDGFYADTPAIFDLLDARILDNDGDPNDGLGQDGNGVDGFKGFNVLAFAIQIPVSALPSFAYTAPFADLANPLPALGGANGVGVYASVSRPRVTLRRTDGDPVQSGPWIQVNRMGNPLFNEVLVALKDKDNYNRTLPTGDNTFATYALNPEVAFLINFVFGTSIPTTGRTDLAAVYIPDVIRVDTTTVAVRLAGQAGFSRFGFAGSDTTTDASGRVKSSGWPNGRRLGDDVVDIALTAVASGPTFSTVTVVGDNIPANDQIYNQVFPYLRDASLRSEKQQGFGSEQMRAMLRRRGTILVLGAALVTAAIGVVRIWYRPATLTAAEVLESVPLAARRSHTDKALAQWAERARRNPSSVVAWTNLGDALMQKSRETMDGAYYGRAEGAFLRALELGRNNSAAMTGLAWVYGSRHEFERSIEWAKKALDADSRNYDAYGLLGDAAIELGDYDGAFKHYQKMIDIRPDLSSYSRGGHLLFLTGDTRKALWLMEKAIAAGAPHAENTAWCRAQLALMLWHTGALLAAEQTAEAGLAQAPENYHLLTAMGRIKAAKRDFNGAIDYYHRASATVPHHDVVVALGDLYSLLGRQEEAQKQYALVEVIHEANRAKGVTGNVELARFYADHDQKLAEASRMAEAEFEVRPNAAAADALAWCYFKSGRLDDAKRLIEKALKPGTPDASVLFHAGMIHEKLGDRSAAKQFLYRALSLNPGFHPVHATVAAETLKRLGS